MYIVGRETFVPDKEAWAGGLHMTSDEYTGTFRPILWGICTSFAYCLTLTACLGCASQSIKVPAGSVDISNVKSEEELDAYLGQRVTFTGTWQNWKRAAISNGHVVIEPDTGFLGSSRGYDVGASETVTGYLTKSIIDDSARRPNSTSQSPPPGNNYRIEKDRPAEDAIVRHYP